MSIRKVELENGKYTLCFNEQTGEFEALRGGEPWRNLCGDKMVLCAMQKIEAQEDEIKQLREALAFYADRTNYGKEKIREDLYLANSAMGITFSNIHHDDGEIARKRLQGGEIK